MNFSREQISSWCQSEGLECRQKSGGYGGPTKLPEKGGGHQQRPGKEEPLVGKEDGEENLRRRLTNKESELVLQHLDDWQVYW